jgi:hypothetical protein
VQSADYSPDDLQGFLRDAWNNAPAAANSLIGQLELEEQRKVTQIKAGMIVSVSKNGVSQSYGTNYRAVTIRDVQRIYSRLIRDVTSVYNEIVCQATNAGANPPGFDYDPLVFAWLITKYDELAMGTTRPDLTNLGLPCLSRTTQPEPDGVWSW